MWKQFDAVVQLPTCSCQAAKDYNDFSMLIKLMQFLMGLDDIYQPVRTNLLTREPLPSVKVAFSIVSREESHRNSSSGTKSQNVSFVAKGNSSFDQKKKEFRGPNPNLKCTHCNKLGHTNDRCFELVGYPPGFKKKPGFQSGKNVSNNRSNASSVSVPSVSPFTPEQVAKLLSLVGEKTNSDSQGSNMGGESNNVDSKSGRILVTGKQDNGLYFVNKNGNSANLCFNSMNNSNLWHSRLGHPAGQVLSILKDEIGVTDVFKHSCEVCHRAKQTRVPFPLSEHKTKDVGDIIHLDVWGPYKVTSKDGFKYFLTVVDDYSRAVWCYLLKNKMEVFENIENFYELVLTQFKKKIKIFRSDNGTEFVNNKMNVFCKTKGILHQTSCAYTPQQNGVAERKHRHLLNLARSLLFQSGVPLSFWADCVLTAVYIINRLPSSVLLGKSPYELMFGFKPSYAHLRVFGCLCFSTVLNDLDKFAFNSEKCVLIGYSNVKKGYKLWSLDNKREFYSRDVKFYESVFPYKSSQLTNQDKYISESVNQLNFFDSVEVSTINSINPNDEEGNNDSHEVAGSDQQSFPSTSATPTDVEQSSSTSGVESSSRSEGFDRAENTETSNDENNLSEGNRSNVRRSNRNSTLPKRFEDFVLNSKTKYSLDKVVRYSCLSAENLCFTTMLNKISEPTCYEEAAKDPRWVEAMNKEMEALFRNNTWTLADLPQNRKAIGCK
ncbi:putative RNA-directed DNA polymerase [Helianthus annuus]|nr:putative RNA-directed DNA polymerase [Helianthus annuus]